MNTTDELALRLQCGIRSKVYWDIGCIVHCVQDNGKTIAITCDGSVYTLEAPKLCTPVASGVYCIGTYSNSIALGFDHILYKVDADQETFLGNLTPVVFEQGAAVCTDNDGSACIVLEDRICSSVTFLRDACFCVYSDSIDDVHTTCAVHMKNGIITAVLGQQVTSRVFHGHKMKRVQSCFFLTKNLIMIQLCTCNLQSSRGRWTCYLNVETGVFSEMWYADHVIQSHRLHYINSVYVKCDEVFFVLGPVACERLANVGVFTKLIAEIDSEQLEDAMFFACEACPPAFSQNQTAVVYTTFGSLWVARTKFPFSLRKCAEIPEALSVSVIHNDTAVLLAHNDCYTILY